MSIKVENISHVYAEGLPHETVALDHVSFQVEEGDVVGIIGHTGSGKSTLVQHLNGLLKATSGNIVVDGIDITDKETSMLEIRKKIGLVFQYPEYQLFEETVEKDVAFGPKNLNLPEEEIGGKVKKAIELVGLDYEEIKDKSPFNLSGGQKRRVAIAGVIAMEPRVLILDEPTAGLDPVAHKDVLKLVEKIHKEENNITIFVSHNMNDIAKLCNKVIVMGGGELKLMGSTKEVFSNVQLLRDMGLDLPEATNLMEDMRARGFDMPKGVLTLEEAEKVLAKFCEDKFGGIN